MHRKIINYPKMIERMEEYSLRISQLEEQLQENYDLKSSTFFKEIQSNNMNNSVVERTFERIEKIEENIELLKIEKEAIETNIIEVEDLLRDFEYYYPKATATRVLRLKMKGFTYEQIDEKLDLSCGYAIHCLRRQLDKHNKRS